MQPAIDVVGFLAQPEGRYLAGRTWLVFHVRREVAGLTMWGSPSVADLAPLFEIFRGFDTPLGAPLPRFFDVRRLEMAEASVIAQLVEFVGRHRTELARIFTAIALVHSGALGRAISEGIRSLATLDFAWETFETTAPALAWLRCSRADALAGEVDELVALASQRSLLAHEVRAYCTAHFQSASLAGAAQALRLSSRTLQRRLTAQHTSFQRELNAARVERAKQLLASSDRSVAEIARDLGCDARHFVSMFRRAEGCSPLAWRQRK